MEKLIESIYGKYGITLNESIKDNLRSAAGNRQASEQAVIDEIVDYFTSRIDSEKFADAVEKYCIRDINDGEKTTTFYLEFWGGYSGASDAYFRLIPGINWEKGEDYLKREYKGIELYKINFAVMERVEMALKDFLKREGFKILDIETPNRRFTDWYKKHIIVSLTDFIDEGLNESLADRIKAKVKAKHQKRESYRVDEARNPANDEVNAILKSKMGKAKLTKKEQAILDKYGITRNNNGEWVGPNGKVMRKVPGKTVYGPMTPAKSWGGSSPYWELGKEGYGDKNPTHKKSYDEVDFANYLTKEPTDPDYTEDRRGESKLRGSKWRADAETPAMRKANRPYSDDYKDVRGRRDFYQDWANTESNQIMSDDDIEKKVADYEAHLKARQKEDAKDRDRYQGIADDAQKEMDDIKNKARAKHKKNESMKPRRRARLTEAEEPELIRALKAKNPVLISERQYRNTIREQLIKSGVDVIAIDCRTLDDSALSKIGEDKAIYVFEEFDRLDDSMKGKVLSLLKSGKYMTVCVADDPSSLDMVFKSNMVNLTESLGKKKIRESLTEEEIKSLADTFWDVFFWDEAIPMFAQRHNLSDDEMDQILKHLGLTF